MKKKLTLLLLLYFFTLIVLFSESLIVNDFRLNNITIIKGEGGRDFFQLKQNEYSPTPETDLLIHFNNMDFIDEAGNYTVISEYNNISSIEKKLGTSSSFFLKDKGIIFTSKGDTIFTPGRIVGDFTIEFWVFPTIISEDTTLFLWKGVNKVNMDFIPQKIKCFIEDRHIVWEFENTFIPADFSNYSIKLKGKSRLIPNIWNHYLIRYNSYNGMLESLLNGIPEAVKYTTPTEGENAIIYPPYIGSFSKNNIYIGNRLRGFIDEFRISESFISEPQLSKFKSSGFFYSSVHDIEGGNIILESIKIRESIEPETTIDYQYRLSDTPFLELDDTIKWLPIKYIPNGKSGRYIQFKGNLYSSGDKNRSPLLENIEVIWSPIPTPPAPLVIITKSLKQSIKIEWNAIKYYNVDGYYLYYGEESNKYIEMIDVGKKTSYTVNGLRSNKIYYFSLRSYMNNKKSDYSSERYNRPE